MKKLVSVFLALVLICTLVPLTAFAAFNPAEYKEIKPQGDKWIGYKPGDETGTDITKEFNEFLKELEKEKEEPDDVVITHGPNDHEYGYASNTKYHWLQCACGCKISVERHVDPLDAPNDYCICGYHFSDNAQLVTLWLKDCKELKDFSKDVYEYETDAYTYKEVNELKRIATRTFDSEATVELPEDLTLKEGENKIEIKVTAENKKVSQIYTVIVNKEAKK